MTDQERPVVIPSYKRVWKIERYLYRIDRIRLFKPVTYLQIGYFAVAFLALFFFNQFTGGLLEHIPLVGGTISRFIVLPLLIAYYLSKAKHDGRPPHKWLWTYMNYRMQPKLYNRYEALHVAKKESYSGKLTFRELYEVTGSKGKKKR
ncbi:TcpE family conjugal transfer membrane protein [Paenibacillus pasadenensis]|uniref:TcpE family conjugal transfer membrane protein n=1 Tax=Paenibacillus pasadenensis TaxID=217090 RepID=UPI0003F7AD3A|nr:TcpE family conjugal transfer membrane protein [Paenibacillus pasadenensis]